MKTIDLSSDTTSRDEIFQLAEDQNVVVRTPSGKMFVVAEISETEADDFAEEIARTRGNSELRQLLAERSLEPGTLSIDAVRRKLGLN